MSDERSHDGGSTPRSPESPEAAGSTGDRALVLGELPEQRGVAILRQRGENAPVEAGVVRKIREGEPIVGELVNLTKAAEGAAPSELPLYDVKVLHDARRPGAATTDAPHKGPPRVASQAYRTGWDALFGPTSDEPSGRTLN